MGCCRGSESEEADGITAHDRGRRNRGRYGPAGRVGDLLLARVLGVSHHHFKNETVPLDGCAYKQSSFENVTFVYQGKAPFEIDDVEYKQGTIRTMTSNGALINYHQLLHKLAEWSGCGIVVPLPDWTPPSLNPK